MPAFLNKIYEFLFVLAQLGAAVVHE